MVEPPGGIVRGRAPGEGVRGRVRPLGPVGRRVTAVAAGVARAVAEEREPLVVSPHVVAELDDLVATRVGPQAALAVPHELSGGAYLLPCLEGDDLAAGRRSPCFPEAWLAGRARGGHRLRRP
jgi:hypothetical protein